MRELKKKTMITQHTYSTHTAYNYLRSVNSSSVKNILPSMLSRFPL